MERFYLDNAATTPLSPAAFEAMAEWADCGNPSSLYHEGRRAKDAIDAARETLSGALGCLFAEVVFTSGGTEAANLAIIGAALQNEDPHRNRILLGAAEHHCVLNTRPILERLGYRVELIPVDREARMRLGELDDTVLLVSTMHANNELGSLNDVPAVASAVHAVGALLHVDAVQTFLKPEVLSKERLEGTGSPDELSVGYSALDSLAATSIAAPPMLHWRVGDLGADLVSVSAHKVNGPKGAGALYIRAGVKLRPILAGGAQEREVRAGTENVAAIAGFAAAVAEHIASPRGVSASLRDRFLAQLEGLGAVRTVRAGPSLSGHAHVRFPGVNAESLLIALDRLGVSAGSGAACSSGAIEPSHVLLACGYSPAEAREGVRFTLGVDTTESELGEAAARVRAAKPISASS